jgi:hypothetical protein
MIQMTAIEVFGTQLSGEALTRGDAGYDQARSAWNGEIDRYPAVIVRCASAADVVAAIGFARQRGLEISVRPARHRRCRCWNFTGLAELTRRSARTRLRSAAAESPGLA